MDLSNRVEEGHYDANMAAFLRIGEWLDHLKELGVYDNTRIIITADHGFALNQFAYLKHENVPIDAESVNPVLLFKDYTTPEDKGVTTDDTFMTNADVPTMALEGIVEDPVNPFTGNPINSDRKKEGPIVVIGNKIEVNAETDMVFDDPSIPWYSVHDDIFDPSNWELLRAAVVNAAQ